MPNSTSQTPYPFAAVILDVDGTLVDSNDLHAQAWVDALREFGLEAPFEKVRKLIGMGGDKLLPAVTGISEDTPRGKEIGERRGEIFQEQYLPKVRPTPGAKDLLEHLKREGLRLVIASSAKTDELKELMGICGAHEIVEDKTSSDDADRSKPDPDIVQAALKKLALSPAEAVMLGDTPYDIQAAGKAGVATIALRSGGWSDADLAGAIAIYDYPADLLARYQSSPLARRH